MGFGNGGMGTGEFGCISLQKNKEIKLKLERETQKHEQKSGFVSFIRQ